MREEQLIERSRALDETLAVFFFFYTRDLVDWGILRCVRSKVA